VQRPGHAGPRQLDDAVAVRGREGGPAERGSLHRIADERRVLPRFGVRREGGRARHENAPEQYGSYDPECSLTTKTHAHAFRSPVLQLMAGLIFLYV
jgi:hypothetical protein